MADNTRTPGKPMAKGFTKELNLEVTRFEQVGGVWAPMDAKASLMDKDTKIGSYSGWSWEHRTTDIKLNPDFDESSFALSDVPEGAQGFVHTPSGLQQYAWHDGKAVPANPAPAKNAVIIRGR